jgi:hypothetical protein
MVEKIAGLARLLATLLAIVAGFVALPANINIALVLVVLGLIAGLKYSQEQLPGLVLVVLVLPLAGAALATIPEVGDKLQAAALNIALAAAGVAATVIAMRLFNNSKDDVSSWTGKKAA